MRNAYILPLVCGENLVEQALRRGCGTSQLDISSIHFGTLAHFALLGYFGLEGISTFRLKN